MNFLNKFLDNYIYSPFKFLTSNRSQEIQKNIHVRKFTGDLDKSVFNLIKDFVTNLNNNNAFKFINKSLFDLNNNVDIIKITDDKKGLSIQVVDKIKQELLFKKMNDIKSKFKLDEILEISKVKFNESSSYNNQTGEFSIDKSDSYFVHVSISNSSKFKNYLENLTYLKEKINDFEKIENSEENSSKSKTVKIVWINPIETSVYDVTRTVLTIRYPG